MKRLVYLFLPVLLLIQSGGMELFFRLKVHAIQYAAKANLNKQNNEDLLQFKLSIEEYRQALVEEGELKMANRLYDIHSMQKCKEGYLVWVKEDIKEKAVLDLLESLFNPKQRQGTNSPVCGTLVLIACQISHQQALEFHEKLIQELCFSPFRISFNAPVLRIDSPPPRLV